MRCVEFRVPLRAAAAILILTSGVALRAQTPEARRPVFEVISAKLNKNCDGHSTRPVLSPGTFHLTCVGVTKVLGVGAWFGAAWDVGTYLGGLIRCKGIPDLVPAVVH